MFVRYVNWKSHYVKSPIFVQKVDVLLFLLNAFLDIIWTFEEVYEMGHKKSFPFFTAMRHAIDRRARKTLLPFRRSFIVQKLPHCQGSEPRLLCQKRGN